MATFDNAPLVKGAHSVVIYSDDQTGTGMSALKAKLISTLLWRENYFQLRGNRKVELLDAVMVVPEEADLQKLYDQFGASLTYMTYSYKTNTLRLKRFTGNPNESQVESAAASASLPVKHAIYMYSFGVWYKMDANNEWCKISAQEILELVGVPHSC